MKCLVHLEIGINCFENVIRSQEEAQGMNVLDRCSSFFRHLQTVVIYRIQFLVLDSYRQIQDDLGRPRHEVA